MVPTQDFESYAVVWNYRGRGLSYALTYVMLLYCQNKGKRRPQVSNAHGALIGALPQVGFMRRGALREAGREVAASFDCYDVPYAIGRCQQKLQQYDLALRGSLKSHHGCTIM